MEKLGEQPHRDLRQPDGLRRDHRPDHPRAHEYALSDIVVGARFADVLGTDERGRFQIDYSKFHDVRSRSGAARGPISAPRATARGPGGGEAGRGAARAGERARGEPRRPDRRRLRPERRAHLEGACRRRVR